jgi:hypothetical protein
LSGDRQTVMPIAKTRSPASGRAAKEVSTSDRAGTGGIQISLPDIDIDMAAQVKT